MDTDKLRYFAVIAETQNLRKAAEILRVTPSGLSKVIKHLENELEVSLITPLGRGITLTKEGMDLARRSSAIIEAVQGLKTQIQEAQALKKIAPLRIATFEVFSTYFLQGLEHIDWGNRKLMLYEVVPGELEQAVEQGRADFGITYLPIPHPQLEHVKVTSILMGVYKRKNSFKDLLQEELPFVVPIFPLTGAPTRVKGLDGWPEDAYQRQVKYEVSLLESAMELCRQGKCVGYFPSFIADRHNRKYREDYALERHPYNKSLKRCNVDVYLVKRKDRTEDRDAKMLSKLIRMGTKLENVEG
jgi:DNA-binding transcriptional LysR family regulator